MHINTKKKKEKKDTEAHIYKRKQFHKTSFKQQHITAKKHF